MVQSLIDSIHALPLQARVVKAFSEHETQLAVHPLASHVLKKCLRSFDVEVVEPLTQSLVPQVVSIVQFQYGVVLIKTLYDCSPPPVQQDLRERLFAVFATVINQEYGNFIFQHFITEGVADYEDSRARVLALLEQNLIAYCCHPFASNVVEKVLDQVKDPHQMLQKQLLGNDSLEVLVHYVYGFYVVCVRAGRHV